MINEVDADGNYTFVYIGESLISLPVPCIITLAYKARNLGVSWLDWYPHCTHTADFWALFSYDCIVKRCFWIQIKFNTKHSNAMHTIITTI